MSNLNVLAEQCDAAISDANEQNINDLIKVVTKYTSKDYSNEKRCCAHYLLGNLHGKLIWILQESASGWRNDNYPKNLTAEINHLRIASKLVSEDSDDLKSRIRTNLSNALAHQRRNIEVLNHWVCDFNIEGDAPFISTLSKARELIWISKNLNNESHQHLYQYEAVLLLKHLKDHIHNTDHQSVINTLDNDSEILHYLENGEEFFKPIAGWKTQHKPDSYSHDEKSYRKWCLKERLFVNPINDITTEWIADQDILQFPNHTVSIGDGPFFAASFSALKREFCFARYMAYEGIHQIHPKFETDKLFLVNTLDYVDYSGSTEKIKAAFRICFSVLDSLSSLMNAYFQCNAKEASFSPKWIRENFQSSDENFFIDALYWLSCDLFDNQKIVSDPLKWKAPNPQASEIRKIRNAIEHGWLRVAESECTIWDKDNDFAHLITPQELQAHTLFILKLVRSAMLYLTMAVKLNEMSKTEKNGIIVQSPLEVMDDEFISLRL
jgi:hypothetical protein